jgi:hypothetical protein
MSLTELNLTVNYGQADSASLLVPSRRDCTPTQCEGSTVPLRRFRLRQSQSAQWLSGLAAVVGGFSLVRMDFSPLEFFFHSAPEKSREFASAILA